jgi:hypothetical protein
MKIRWSNVNFRPEAWRMMVLPAFAPLAVMKDWLWS